MKLGLRVLCILFLVSSYSFSQQSNTGNQNGSADILPAPVNYDEAELERQNFNPNGVKVYFEEDPNLVAILFKEPVSEVKIEVIDKRGRMIDSYVADEAGKVHINIARLNQGSYYIRLKSKQVKDFLKFVKR